MNIGSWNKEYMKINWSDYLRIKSISQNDHEKDHPTDNSKVENRHEKKFRITSNRIQILIFITRRRGRRNFE